MDRKTLAAAFPATVPVLMGYLAIGMAFGLMLQTAGYGVGWALLMSLTIYAGSGQYLGVSLLATGAHLSQVAFLTLMINFRHLVYGLSMLEKYKGLGKLRPFLIFWLTDETYSICSGITPPADVNRKYFYGFISALDYSYWILGTFLGGVLGNLITFNTTGMDFVLTALFVVLFVEQLTSKNKALSGLVGLGGTAAVLAVFGADNLVIISMVVILLILLIGRKKLCT